MRISLRNACRVNGFFGRTLLRPLSSQSLQAVGHDDSSSVPPMNQPELFTVALVGKPNVGKSTLFNRLCGKRIATVSALPGTTRDRNVGLSNFTGLSLRIIDTGGFDDTGHMNVHILSQLRKAIRQSDVIALILDGKDGVDSTDEYISRWLRKEVGKVDVEKKKDIFVIVNKTEGSHLSDRALATLAESSCLGFGEPLFISASHGEGLAELSTTLMKYLTNKGFPLNGDFTRPHDDPNIVPIQVAIMGRPNVGKSSLVNSILKENRVISGPSSHLTRDAIFVEWFALGRHFRLVDTPGLSHIPKRSLRLSAKNDSKSLRAVQNRSNMNLLQKKAENSLLSKVASSLSARSAFDVLRYSHVVVLTVEGSQGNFSAIDLKLANRCLREGRAMVICANKRDIVALGGLSSRQYELGVRKHCEAFMRDFGEIPIVSTAATTYGITEAYHSKKAEEKMIDKLVNDEEYSYDSIHAPQGTERLLRAIIRTHDAWSKRIPTSALNSWLSDVQINSVAPRKNGKDIRVKFITQTKTRPPGFVLFTNCQIVPVAYSRFLRRKLQNDFKFGGVPIRFTFRKAKGKIAENSLLSRSISRNVCSSGESRPVGKARDNRYLEVQRKLAQVDRRRRSAKLQKMRKRHARNLVRYKRK